jgi:LytS/YehU family sensor histidine kinase
MIVMYLLPYVENAIRHGIRFLQNKMGQININVTKEKEYLICRIDDNGIGREKALALRNQMHTEYQSRGMQLSKRRADLYHIELEIIDKSDEKGFAAGTAVVLKIPLTLKP